MAASASIDQNLYSRQLAVFGGEAMGKLVQMEVLLVGLGGVGVETAKNLILAGPKSVTLFDPTPTTIADVGRNYYLKPEHVGAPRAASCVDQLKELNPYVAVSVLAESALTDAIVSRFHVVVFTDTPRSELLRWNAVCRAKSPQIGFIAADVRGVAGYAFVDFGDAFTVRDPNGENVKNAVVTAITRSNPAHVNTHDGKRHGFSDGDYVVFREVEGMIELNDGKPRRITNVRPFTFDLEEDTTGFGEHLIGGIVEQTKVPQTHTFASLADRVKTPLPADDPMGMLITPDLGKFGRSEQLHVAFAAIEAFRDKNGSLPALRNADHAAQTVELAKAWLAANPIAGVHAVDEGVVTTLALTASAELPALSAFYGGIVAQEVVKYTGKFTPLRQWLYLDAFEVLPADHEKLPAAEYALPGSRYDNMIAIVGNTHQTRIMNQRAFVVGAGALGCEFLKNFALMGVGCGPTGRVTVTDMDRIEVSNLNRQFLFRSHNVGQPKSVTAAAAAQAMNGDLKVEALETPVGEDTETVFTDAFWEGLDIVVNALDNLKARTYVDTRCIFYGKPLLESGTLGTKANTQVIVPRMTECYSDSQDPAEEAIPMCTLRNFPHAIEHCIEWARDLFAGCYTNNVQEASAFLSDPAGWLSKQAEEGNMAKRRANLTGVLEVLKSASNATYETCVAQARHLFNAHFAAQIHQLLHNFPADYADAETGVKFWSPPKRVPTPAEFNTADPAHWDFVTHAAAMYAAAYGVALPAGWDSHAVVDPILAGITVPPFVPKSARIKKSEADATEEGADDDAEAVASLSAEVSKLAASGGGGASASGGAGASSSSSGGLHLFPAEFEKDDDSNHHVDFITAAANLRARNYKIKEATRYEVKLTAGKIIPAIATTTCAVTGLVAVELYKVVAGKPIEQLRNTFMNLAINAFSMAEPMPPKRTKSVDYDPIVLGPIKARPEGFTRWDRVIIKDCPGLTPDGLDKWLQANHGGIRLEMIGMGQRILYNALLYPSHRANRKNKPIVDIITEATGHAPTKPYVLLDVSGEDDDGSVMIPPVQLYY